MLRDFEAAASTTMVDYLKNYLNQNSWVSIKSIEGQDEKTRSLSAAPSIADRLNIGVLHSAQPTITGSLLAVVIFQHSHQRPPPEHNGNVIVQDFLTET